MNYKKIYDNLINSRLLLNRTKKDNVYYEKHHILPKSIGGSNNDDNLVFLTYKEHFLAHRLLVEIYSGEEKRKMNYALWRMSSSTKKHERILTSRQYQICREAQINAKKNHSRSEETRKKISNSHKGKTISEKTRQLISNKLTGRQHLITEETKQKISKSNTGKKRSPETIEKNRLNNLGKKQSIETVEKRRQKLLGKARPIEVIEKIKANNIQKKKVLCSNGIIYDSISEAAEQLNLCKSNVGSVCRGKRNNCGGFTFKFV